MSNPSKQKGTAWEGDCRDALRPVFPDVERSPLWGANDRGDLLATRAFTFECKAVKSFNLSQFIEEAKVEAQNAGKEFPVVLLKRPRKSTLQGYAVMEIGTLLKLIERSGL